MVNLNPLVPHDDEITWDAHDRIPERTTEFSGGMPKIYRLAFGLALPIILALIALVDYLVSTGKFG